MLKAIFPLVLVVISNVFYQICTKSVPSNMNPLASLTITYTIGAFLSLLLYYILNKNANICTEFTKINWAPFILGFAIVGLEIGFIYMYKSGWSVSTAQIVQASILAIILIFVGFFLYKEQITWNKIIGIIICLIGLIFINLK